MLPPTHLPPSLPAFPPAGASLARLMHPPGHPRPPGPAPLPASLAPKPLDPKPWPWQALAGIVPNVDEVLHNIMALDLAPTAIMAVSSRLGQVLFS